jgi:hypothetical protein
MPADRLKDFGTYLQYLTLRNEIGVTDGKSTFEYRIRYMSLSICDSAVRCYIFSILAASMAKRIYCMYSTAILNGGVDAIIHLCIFSPPPPPPPHWERASGTRGVVYQRNEVSHSLGISQTPGLSRGVPPSYRVSALLPGFPRFPFSRISMYELL